MDSTKSIRIKDQIREVILTDFDRIMKTPESLTGKFILITVGIEYLGACLDRQHLYATGRSEKRFNLAILKLFPTKYHHFVKQLSVPYLYSDFRCPIIHQFKAGKTVFLCSALEAETGGFRHLTYDAEGSLILVAEEFFKDLALAGMELIKRIDSKELV